MGREAIAVCHWCGDIAEAKLHLDSKSLQLRGDLRADIPREDITDVHLDDAGLRVVTLGEDLLLEFGADDAAKWQKALLKKPPTLAEKLGVSSQMQAFVLGSYEDRTLAQALEGATVAAPADAVILMAVILSEGDLARASDLALLHTDKHLWTVYRKGKTAVVGDTQVRAHMRGLGFIDSKSCAVSGTLTATRYRLRTT